MTNETKEPKKPENELSWKGVEKYFATEVIEQGKKNAKRWFVAWIATMIALVGTNVYWIYQFNSYDYVSQDGEGINNINTGDQGDLNNGAESEN